MCRESVHLCADVRGLSMSRLSECFPCFGNYYAPFEDSGKLIENK